MPRRQSIDRAAERQELTDALLQLEFCIQNNLPTNDVLWRIAGAAKPIAKRFRLGGLKKAPKVAKTKASAKPKAKAKAKARR